jgi:hypothetical protein
MTPAPSPQLSSKLQQALSRVQAVLRMGSEQQRSPYSLQRLTAAANGLHQWASSGARGNGAEVLAALDEMEREASAVLEGKVRFEEQLDAHLGALRELIQLGVEGNLLSAPQPELLEGQLRELQQRAASLPMTQSFRRATALELCIQSTLLEAQQAKQLMRKNARLR